MSSGGGGKLSKEEKILQEKKAARDQFGPRSGRQGKKYG